MFKEMFIKNELNEARNYSNKFKSYEKTVQKIQDDIEGFDIVDDEVVVQLYDELNKVLTTLKKATKMY